MRLVEEFAAGAAPPAPPPPTADTRPEALLAAAAVMSTWTPARKTLPGAVGRLSSSGGGSGGGAPPPAKRPRLESAPACASGSGGGGGGSLRGPGLRVPAAGGRGTPAARPLGGGGGGGPRAGPHAGPRPIATAGAAPRADAFSACAEREHFSGLRIRSRLVSDEMMRRRMEGRAFVRLEELQAKGESLGKVRVCESVCDALGSRRKPVLAAGAARVVFPRVHTPAA